MSQPDQDKDQTSRPEDDDPRSLTGEPATAPEGSEESLFDEEEL